MNRKNLDRAGIAASTLCAAHCILGALFAGTAGFLQLFTEERSELIFVSIAVLIAAVAMTLGFLRHRNVYPPLFALVGLFVLASARFVEVEMEVGEVALSVVGASMLVVAHVLNLKCLQRFATCCAEQECAAQRAPMP